MEFNIEGNPIPEFLSVVGDVRPDQVTLVPDNPGQLTSDHGWDIKKEGERLRPIIKDLHGKGIRVSLFVDPILDHLDLIRTVGADRIELYTEPYARAFGTELEDEVWERFNAFASKVQAMDIGVNAGHDLNLNNLPRFLAITEVLEVSIGHAIVVESFDYGFEETLRQYLKIVGN